MKLNSLQLRHFISHTETDLVLNGARLATFVGANGSGKSALAIDALRYALFDDARGRTDDLVQLGQTDMSVRAEISFAGAEYAITRGRSTKARGSSYLELMIRDPEGWPGQATWRPLTGDTIKDTQEKIGALLRMDAATFDTAVLLGQGQANRFAEATAGDRKKILGTVLGLDLWERAEARAREEARDVEGKTAADRATVARLEAELTTRANTEAGLAADELVDFELTNKEQAVAHRQEELLRDRDKVQAELAAGQVAIDAVTAAQTKLNDVTERYRRVSARKTTAAETLAEARRKVATAPDDADALAAAEPAAATEVAQLEKAGAEDQSLERAVAQGEAGLANARSIYALEVAAWRSRKDAAQRRVDELTADVAALPPITCPKCAYEWPHDQAGLGAKLLAARTTLRDLPPEPAEPMHLAIESAKIERLRINRREIAFDAAVLAAARARLTSAGIGRSYVAMLEAQRAIADTSKRAIDECDLDLVEVGIAGTAARAALGVAESQVSGLSDIRIRLEQVDGAIHVTAASRADVIRERQQLARGIGAQKAALERLDRVQIERDTLAATLADSDRKLARLRRLVAAFSVKGIPARIIESVLPELTASANELLEQLRPGMTLDIRAQRAKADGKGIVEALDLIVQDDAGERALGMYSGGERMSVSLALAVGLSRLVARRAGTAIRTLVIDEPDGLDQDARRSFGQALRILAHQGELERVVLVSHHQDLADVGDAVYQVTKGPAGSTVGQIA